MKRVADKDNLLISKRPDIASQFHPHKNAGIDLATLTHKSGKKVWWCLPYDDPKSGKHFDFVWRASVFDRVVRNHGCPYIAQKKVWPGYNDLLTRYPEIAKEWNYRKNGDLTPDKVMGGSDKDVWWILPYEDPLTGKHFDFEWKAKICSRTSNNNGCPYLNGTKVWQGYNDLASRFPDIAVQWHPTKNGALRPDLISSGSSFRAWWIFPYDDPKTGKHFSFEWQAPVYQRVKNGVGCPYLNNGRVWKGFNDLQSRYPEIAAQWHPIKNGKRTPEEISYKSQERVWWYQLYEDPETGKKYEFVWKARVYERTINGAGCPYMSGSAVLSGYNDLLTRFPKVAELWHPQKNGKLKPDMVTGKSTRKVWWYLPYNDPETGKHFEFEWHSRVCSMTKENDGRGCPYLNGQAVWPGYNDLESRYPEIAATWHPTKNGALTPSEITYGSARQVWWYLPYDDPVTGKHYDFEWKSPVYRRTVQGCGCPVLSGYEVCRGFNDLASRNPELVDQWHPTKNGILGPSDTYMFSHKKVWWIYPYDDPVTGKHFDFEWRASVENRARFHSGCPYLTKNRVWTGFNDLATLYPEIALDWDLEKNGHMLPNQVYAKSRSRRVWWKCRHCGYQWRSLISNRTVTGNGCKNCSKKHKYI